MSLLLYVSFSLSLSLWSNVVWEEQLKHISHSTPEPTNSAFHQVSHFNALGFDVSKVGRNLLWIWFKFKDPAKLKHSLGQHVFYLKSKTNKTVLATSDSSALHCIGPGLLILWCEHEAAAIAVARSPLNSARALSRGQHSTLVIKLQKGSQQRSILNSDHTARALSNRGQQWSKSAD